MLQKSAFSITEFDDSIKKNLRGNSRDFCEVVTRMLYGNVQQIDKIYQPPFIFRVNKV